MPSKLAETVTGRLYLVATPIGNLADVTLRALDVLRQADYLAVEDTRRSRILLSHYGIKAKLVAYHRHNRSKAGAKLLELLRDGASVALITDGGTPVVSDPGMELVTEALEAGVQVIPIPGASAPTAALSIAGFPSVPFLFEGFLPSKAGQRRKRLEELSWTPYTLVLFEAPHRLVDTLSDIADLFGDRPMVLAREMTKIHETFLRGSAQDILQRLDQEAIRGEITLIIRGFEGEPTPSLSIGEELKLLLEETGKPMGELVKQVAASRGIPKRIVYEEGLRLKRELEDDSPAPEDLRRGEHDPKP